MYPNFKYLLICQAICFISFHIFITTENLVLRTIVAPFSFLGFMTGFADVNYSIVGNLISGFILWIIFKIIHNGIKTF